MNISEKIDLFLTNSNLTDIQKGQLIELFVGVYRQGIMKGKERKEKTAGSVGKKFNDSVKWFHYN